MRECINCKSKNKKTDIYCRNCGTELKSNGHYVLISVFTVLVFFLLVCEIILAIVTFLIK